MSGRRGAGRRGIDRHDCRRVTEQALERLEPRWLFDIYAVTTTSDVVAGSLRWAIESANANPGPDTITFAFSGGGRRAITPTNGPLPAVTDTITIDGWSEGGPDYSGPPLIRIDASPANTNATGLAFLNVDGNVVRGLALTRWGTGLAFYNNTGGTGNNAITGNYIGLSTDGQSPLGSAYVGLYLSHSSDNTISNNVISANGTATASAGVLQVGGSGNVYAGNLIGTDASGTKPLGNGGQGIYLSGGATNNRIGTDADGVNDAAERNVIAASGFEGIVIADAGSINNVIAGNYIGLAIDGIKPLGNGAAGISLYGGASSNQVGIGPADVNPSAGRNIISNNPAGVQLSGGNTLGNVIAGNYIGTDVSGELPRGNRFQGVALFSGATGNRIAQNVISANGATNGFAGVEMYGTNITGNAVQGNFIGTDAGGTARLGNGGDGVIIHNGPAGNLVGSNFDGHDDSAERNVISANRFAGVEVSDAGSSNNVVAGNYFGTDLTGRLPLGNINQGVFIGYGASANTIDRNVIGANGLPANFAAVELYASATANVVTGNLIGLDATGTNAMGNGGVGVYIHLGSSNNRIGTNGDGVSDSAEGNTIANSAYGGVEIDDAGSNGNRIGGNRIGTDATGTRAMPNGGPGVWVRFGASNNQIGGPSAALGNVIAYNGSAYAEMGGYHYADAPGVVVTGTGTGNSIRGNSIYGNRGQGIDLSRSPEGSFSYFDGVNVNHAHGVAAGPNHLQNYPVLLAASSGSAATAVSGKLAAVPNTFYTLDFYASSAPNASLFGDGERYLGAATVTTDAGGNANFAVSFAAATSGVEYLTATATDASGNTSEFSAARKLDTSVPVLSSTTWTPIGPGPISTLGDGVVTAGRVADAVPDPSNPNVMYLVADGGGVWKTTNWLDPQPNWTPLTDSQSSLQQDVGYSTLAIAPSDPQLLYDAVSGPGSGILRSTNGGSTWTLLGAAQFHGTFFSGIAVSPSDPDTVYVGVWHSASPGGVYKSVDGGAHWTDVTASVHGGDASDVVMDPSNSQVLYAALTADAFSGNGAATAGIYKSTDGGGTWLTLGGGLPASANVGAAGRVVASSSNPQILFATVFDRSLGNAPDGLPHRFSSTNGGSTWAPMTDLPTSNDDRYWHNVLAVDPANALVVYANADHELYRSTDGGATWAANPIFAEDPVNVRFDGTGALVLTGDRGIYRWPGNNTPFANKQGNLQNTENYTITLDPNDENTLYAVAQDQGNVQKYSGTGVWTVTTSGNESGKVLVSPTNSARIWDFASAAGNGDGGPATAIVIRSDDGGATWADSAAGLPAAIANFPQAYTFQKSFAMDPANPHRLVLGLSQVYETTDDADSWHSITGNADLSPGHYISALAIAPSAPGTIYAATDDGRLWTTGNGGASWAERDVNLPIAEFNRVVDMKVDPANPQRVFAVTSADRTGLDGPHVWMTANGGVSWTNMSGLLNPQVWVQSIAVDWRFANPVLYIGTARGVQSTMVNGSSTAWAPFASGLPNVVVEDLELLPNSNLLAAATYGRGVWEIRVPTLIGLASGNNVVSIKRNGGNAEITVNGVPQQISIAQASAFTVTGGSGDDTLTINFSAGNPLPAGGIAFDGGSGANTLKVIGTPADDVLTAGPGGITFAGGTFGNVPIHVAGVQAIQFPGGSGGSDSVDIVSGSYTVDADTPAGAASVSVVIGPAGAVTFASDQHLADLHIDGGTASIVAAMRQTLTIGGLAITGNGVLDLGRSLLLVENALTPEATIRQYLANAYNADPSTGIGNWLGTGGITSSDAIASHNGANPDFHVSIGYVNGAYANDPLINGPIPGQEGLATNRILVRPALYGDLNLDGHVDDTDLAIFSGLGQYNQPNATFGWLGGDLNHDGKVDDTDLLIFSGAGNYNGPSYGAAPAAAHRAPSLTRAAAPSPSAPQDNSPAAVGAKRAHGARRRHRHHDRRAR